MSPTKQVRDGYCLVINADSVFVQLKPLLPQDVPVKCLKLSDNPVPILRSQTVFCVILYVKESFGFACDRIKIIRAMFSVVPILVVIDESTELDAIRVFGQLGVNKVIGIRDLNLITDVLRVISENEIANVKLCDLNIDATSDSPILCRSLNIIENEYVTLMSIQEIADRIGVNESTLSREFKKANLQNPKRILMLMKIRHSTNLMTNPGLSIKEIARLSGFSNTKRFIECFKKVYFTVPSRFRNTSLVQNEVLGDG